MNKKFLLLISMIFSLTTSTSFAWWDVGHMVIAQIAYEELTPEAREKVDEYIDVVSGDFPGYSDFISASVWADDISESGIKSFFFWHGASRPYDPLGVLSVEEYESKTYELVGKDAVWAIGQCGRTLKNSEASDWAKGFMLRMLVHVVGDLHQPLHCVTYYGPEFPQGDCAGTLYLLNHTRYATIHRLFDAAFGLMDRLGRRIHHPPYPEEREHIYALAAYVQKMYPREILDNVDVEDPDQWRQESYNLGVTFAYERLPFNSIPDEEMMLEGQKVTAQRIALAGYRLADLLNILLDD